MTVHVDPDLRSDVARRYLAEDLPHLLLIDPRLGVIGVHANDYRNDAGDIASLLESADERRFEALRRTREALGAAQDSPESGQADVRVGDVAFEQFRLEDAEEAYTRAIDKLTESEARLKEEVEVLRIYIRVILGDHREGLRLAVAFLDRYPRSSFRPRALYYRCYLSYDSGDFQEARRAMRELESEAPKSHWTLEARELVLSLGDE